MAQQQKPASSKPASSPAAVPVAAKPAASPPSKPNPKVILETTMGTIKLELWADRIPATVGNFIRYVQAKHYDGLIFHRVIPGFMVQGGGLTPDMKERKTAGPIKNEAPKGCKNRRGMIAMARTSQVDSATCQFFINVADNDFLDYKGDSPDKFGYCAFGRVLDGMDVVDSICEVATGKKAGHDDVPMVDILITSARCED
ncbi:MAG: peptidylprolyl isomerase [Planctomycetes bacterium]|nr:peptidylprolyl isomerase [Planctomycetota bacterium]